MKHILKASTLLLLFVFVFVLTSCKKDDNSSSSSSSTNTIQEGKWKVSSYLNKGVDETNHFTGYEFQFNSGGMAFAVKGSSSLSGSWSTSSDDSQQKFYLNFSSSPVSELNSDWHIVMQTDTELKLEDVSGGGGGTDNLIFTKI